MNQAVNVVSLFDGVSCGLMSRLTAWGLPSARMKRLRLTNTQGNNGLVKKKYITFGIEAANLRDAKPKLERIEADIIGNFKSLGVTAQPLNGLERLEVLHGVFHPDGKEKLRLSWKRLAKRANETRSIYESDIQDLQAHYEKLWVQAEAILRGLANIRR